MSQKPTGGCDIVRPPVGTQMRLLLAQELDKIVFSDILLSS